MVDISEISFLYLFAFFLSWLTIAATIPLPITK
jgi:hypothetical protein